MNTARISQAIKDIETNTAALKWLEQYGYQLTGRDKEQMSIHVLLNPAGACPGSKEAAEVLGAFARLEISKLVQISITNCRNTIDSARSVIADEIAKDAI